jgi:hypothetical protein
LTIEDKKASSAGENKWGFEISLFIVSLAIPDGEVLPGKDLHVPSGKTLTHLPLLCNTFTRSKYLLKILKQKQIKEGL